MCLSTIESDKEAKALEEGKYSVVYGTPESLLKTMICVNDLCQFPSM